MATENGKGKSGLMLVEDPEDTIKAMCHFKEGTLDLHSFKKVYEEIKHRSTPIHEKHAHTHFYTLTIYGLIAPYEGSSKATYKLTPIGNEICECMDRSDSKGFKRILSGILLNNSRKGKLFRDFLSFVCEKDRRTKQEIFAHFRGIPGRTLIAWSKAAGLVEHDEEFVWGLPRGEKKVANLQQFEEDLVKAYKELSKSEMLGVQRIFVEISELRQRICINYSWTLEEFNDCLTRLLDSPFGDNIRLYGAPPSVFDERENFMYHGRLYIYIRIKV